VLPVIPPSLSLLQRRSSPFCFSLASLLLLLLEYNICSTKLFQNPGVFRLPVTIDHKLEKRDAKLFPL
jgi:hypothetical protein